MLDYWIGLQQGLSYDADGAWGASGRVHPELMERLMADPYFSAPPPKSTGREAFNPAWLETGMSGLSVAAAVGIVILLLLCRWLITLSGIIAPEETPELVLATISATEINDMTGTEVAIFSVATALCPWIPVLLSLIANAISFGTGLLLKLVYRPFPDMAYDSILTIQRDVPFGLWIRNIHHWSANFLVFVCILHLLRVFFSGGFYPPRQFVPVQ